MDPDGKLDFPNNGTALVAAADEPVEFKAIKIVFYFVILSCSTFGNSMVIFTICSSKRMRTTCSNLLIVSLAVCDLLTPLVSIPLDFVLEEYSYKWIYGPLLCKLLWPLATLLATSSSLTLAAISLDRYRNIMHPFKSRLTARQIKVIIPSVYVFSLLAVSPYIYALELEGETCQENWWKFVYRRTYTVFLFLVQYAVPLVFMAITYTLALKNLYSTSCKTSRSRSATVTSEENLINSHLTGRLSLMSPGMSTSRNDGKELNRSPRPRRFSLPTNKNKYCTKDKHICTQTTADNKLNSDTEDSITIHSTNIYSKYLHPEDSARSRTTRRCKLLRRHSMRSSFTDLQEEHNVRATKMFVAVVVVFAVFMFPNQVVWLWADFSGGHNAPHFNQATIICWLFTYTNSVCNWIIYAYMNKQFRSGFKKIYRKFIFRSCVNSRKERQVSTKGATRAASHVYATSESSSFL